MKLKQAGKPVSLEGKRPRTAGAVRGTSDKARDHPGYNSCDNRPRQRFRRPLCKDALSWSKSGHYQTLWAGKMVSTLSATWETGSTLQPKRLYHAVLNGHRWAFG